MINDEIRDRAESLHDKIHGPDWADAIESAIRTAVEAEREACMKVCEDHTDDQRCHGDGECWQWIRDAIRARKEQP